MNPSPAQEPSGARDSVAASAPEWTHRPERGSPALIRFMAWVSLALGRAPARVLLHLIAAYFLAFSARPRRFSRDFLVRALGRPPTLADLYRHFLAFSSTIHDRIFFVAERFESFDFRVQGEEAIDSLPEGTGAILMGAHLGSFEALRSFGRGRARRRVTMAMNEENAHKLEAVLAAIDPRAAQGIVALGRLDSMLKLNRELERGALVGVLADRTPGREHAVALPFLGSPAAFPTGPMRMAAILRARVIFMTGLYRGANRYDIHFEALADFSAAGAQARGERDRLVREATARYAARLEHYARANPYNWFNFHDFWSPRDAA